MNFFKFFFSLLFLSTFFDLSAIEIKKAKVGQIELAYYTRGSGDPLLMVIGFRRTMSNWDPALLEILEKHYTLILFDHRGVGLSTDTDNHLTTIPQMADDAAGLVKALGYEKINVLGWSMGGRVSQQLAIRHPDLVSKLILCGTNPGGKYRIPPKRDTESEEESEKQPLMFPDTPEGRLASYKSKARIKQALEEGKIPDNFHVSKETVRRQVHAIKQWYKSNENYSSLPKIKAMTLVTCGLEDALDPPENSLILASRIPFAWSAYFPKTGHAFIFQNYESFSELVLLFLKQ